MVLLLSSCFKEDEKVIPLKPGNVETYVIEMLPEYTIQTYFSFSDGGIVSSNDRSNWDMALSCEPGDYTLWLNTSVFMKAARTGVFDFNVSVSSQNLELLFDESTGRIEGNAIGKWWINNSEGLQGDGEVILIDRGIDSEGEQRGFVKIQPSFDPLSGDVMIKIAATNGSNERSFVITPENGRRVTAFSFDTGVTIPQPEPAPDQWDVLFTTYTTMLYTNTGEPYPYLVNGVLLNDTLVKAALDTIVSFGEVNREYAESLQLSYQKDIIGYDWKEINGDVTSGNITYTARPDWNYIIRDRFGIFYKLRFIDFYNSQGKKGYPTFEVQRL